MSETSSGQRIIQSMRSESANFDLFIGSPATSLYADGVGAFLIGPQNSKIQFYQVSELLPEDGKMIEQREIIASLTIPTLQLLESMMNALDTVAKNREAIAVVGKRINEKVEQLLQSAEKMNAAK